VTRHLSWLLLALSLLFNVFFLAGYFQARSAPVETAPANAETVAHELNLDEKQAAVLSGCRASLGEEAPVYHNALALVAQEYRRELGSDEPDPTRLAELVEQEAEIHLQWRLAATDRLVQFIGSLRPEQRQHLVEASSRSPRHAARLERMLERFDADGNGVLDDAEAAAATEHLQEKRQEMDGRRQRMMLRFDEDGDGELGPEEREAMRRHMKRRRGGPDSPGPR
jgi:hypothetical protein